MLIRLIYQYVRSLKCGDQFEVTLSDEKVPTWWQIKREELNNRENKEDQ